MVKGDKPGTRTSHPELEEIKLLAEKNPDKALSELEALDLSLLPKRLTAEVYWLISECYLKKQLFTRALMIRQKAVDLDPALQHILSSKEIFDSVDRVLLFGIQR